MTAKKKITCAAVGVSMLAMAMYVVRVHAMTPEQNPPTQEQEVTLIGQVVDLHTFMTGKVKPEEQAKRAADCIREGVPTALKTSDGLVILGQGTKSPARALLPLAYKDAEVKGKVFTKDGIKYLDITEAKAATSERSSKDEG